MTEEFLWYIWRFRLYNSKELVTSEDEALEVISPGILNTDSGPDFTNAKVKIRDTTWAGNVEVHVKSSDWARHNHQQDAAYNNIILHVVYENDKPLAINGNQVPTFVLKEKFNPDIYKNYLRVKENKSNIPCDKQIQKLPELVLSSWQNRLVIERLERKTKEIMQALEQNNYNWEETFYIFLARNFGFKVNNIPFELLAKSMPLNVLQKHDQLFQTEALLFGQAGFLHENFTEDYPKKLQKEYEYLRQKFSLTPLEKHLWKFMRLRPHNFPTLRIAQLAMLLHGSKNLFSKVLEAGNQKALFSLFNTEAAGYWTDHYQFEKASIGKTKKLGAEAINNLIINTIVPFLFVYGKTKREERYVDRALALLEQTKNEKNKITDLWKSAGIKSGSAYHSQALIELYNEYCTHKKCLNCNIGTFLLKAE